MENIQRKKAVTSVTDVMYPESQLANNRQVLYTDNISVHFTGFDGDFQSSVRQLATAFLPMSKQHEEMSSKENKVVADLAGILQDEVPNCSFVQLVDRHNVYATVCEACLSRNNSLICKVCRYIIWNNYR